MKRSVTLLAAISAVAIFGSAFADKTKAASPPAAKSFSLPDADGKTHSLADFKGKVVVLEWTNPQCPFVIRHYKAGTMKSLAEKYADQGVVWLAVNSSRFNKPEDSKKWAEDQKLGYATLQDPDGKVGAEYGAKTTPHIFIVDKDGNLAYQGAIDSDPSGSGENVRNYVDEALGKLVKGEQPDTAETKSYGCSVKYKK
jgi:peroxiredoxin